VNFDKYSYQDASDNSRGYQALVSRMTLPDRVVRSAFSPCHIILYHFQFYSKSNVYIRGAIRLHATDETKCSLNVVHGHYSMSLVCEAVVCFLQ
jgi:hypothetical protein